MKRSSSAAGPSSPDWNVPTRADATWFALRTLPHRLRRWWRNRMEPVARHAAAGARLADAPVIAEQRSPLWSDGRPEEFILVAGKVHNLRLACRRFDGVVVPAGATVSFWRQLGRATRAQGYVEGREVREGCVIPTVGGGLCQLSNALLRCALQAGLEVTERHGHTRRIEDQDEAPERADATVFWNYVDLRFVAREELRIEAMLDGDELVVRLRAAASAAATDALAPRPRTVIALHPHAAVPVARGCLSCDETECFRHGPDAAGTRVQGPRTAILVDEWTPEFAGWLREHAPADARWFLPWQPWRAGPRWSVPPAQVHVMARAAAIARALLTRWLAWRHPGSGTRQRAVMAGRERLAAAYARALRPEHRHLVVDQALLAPLQALRVLDGRDLVVLSREMPIDELQQRLDAAHRRQPAAASLADFRCDPRTAAHEQAALRRARRVVTPHAAVAAHLRGRLGAAHVEQIAWQLPEVTPIERGARRAATRPTLLLPASALARKGTIELAQALRELPEPVQMQVLVLGSGPADPAEWHGIDWRPADPVRWPHEADIVVLPAHVEHAPRAVLQALAHGLPAVVTDACGLDGLPGVTVVPAGDAQALREALRTVAAALDGTGPHRRQRRAA